MSEKYGSLSRFFLFVLSLTPFISLFLSFSFFLTLAERLLGIVILLFVHLALFCNRLSRRGRTNPGRKAGRPINERTNLSFIVKDKEERNLSSFLFPSLFLSCEEEHLFSPLRLSFSPSSGVPMFSILFIAKIIDQSVLSRSPLQQ